MELLITADSSTDIYRSVCKYRIHCSIFNTYSILIVQRCGIYVALCKGILFIFFFQFLVNNATLCLFIMYFLLLFS